MVVLTFKLQTPCLAIVMLPAWTKSVEARPSGLIGDLFEVPRLTMDQLAQGGAKTFIELGSSRITHAIASLGSHIVIALRQLYICSGMHACYKLSPERKPSRRKEVHGTARRIIYAVVRHI